MAETYEVDLGFALTLDNLKTGIAIINYQWAYMYINKSYAQQMQLNCESIIGKPLFESGSEAGTNYFFNNVCQHVMNNRTAIGLETRIIFNSKHDVWTHVRVAPVSEGILIKLKDSTIKKLS